MKMITNVKIAMLAAAFGAVATTASAVTCDNSGSISNINQLVEIEVSPATLAACGPSLNDNGGWAGYLAADSAVFTVPNGLTDLDPSDTTFSINLLQPVDEIILFIKQATLGAAFSLSLPAVGVPTEYSWGIYGPGNGAPLNNDYSHYAFYYKPFSGGNTGFEVPLPASLPLLLAGIGGLGMFRRMKRKSS